MVDTTHQGDKVRAKAAKKTRKSPAKRKRKPAKRKPSDKPKQNKGGTGAGNSLYKPEYCKQVIDHMATGLSFDSFCGLLGHSRKVVYHWVKVHPEFKEAKE